VSLFTVQDYLVEYPSESINLWCDYSDGMWVAQATGRLWDGNEAIGRIAGDPVAAVTALLAAQAFGAEPAAQAVRRVQITPAAADVLAERQRQITEEDHRRSEDDEYQNDELIQAAAAYLAANTHFSHIGGQVWPWDTFTFKPSTPRRNLVKAAALILAEIERLDRAGLKASGRT